MTKTMKFLKPYPDAQKVMSTVRDGDKWANLSIGEIINIEGVDSKFDADFREAKVVGIISSDLADIPSEVFKSNYDPEWRTKKSVAKGLHEIYGKPDYIIRDQPTLHRRVTVVFLFLLP